MFDSKAPAAVRTYQAGRAVQDEELEAARDQLGCFRRARSDDYQVHRSRQKLRAQNLRYLSIVLLPLVAGIAWLLAMIETNIDAARGIALIRSDGRAGCSNQWPHCLCNKR